MNKVVVPLVAALLLGTGPASADTAEQANARPAMPLGLANALEVAVRQNPSLARASIDISVAQASVLESLGIDDWVLTGTGAWSSTRRDPVEGDVFVTTGVDNYSLASSIGRSLSTGGTISFDTRGIYSNVTSFVVITDDNGNILDTQEFDAGSLTVGLSATFTQPLMRGFGKDVARGVQKQARIQKNIAELTRESIALDTTKAIIDTYWEVAYAAVEIKIRKGSLELANEQLRIINAGIDAGATAPTASLPLEQGILVREEAILVAEVSLSNLSLLLRRLVGLEVGPGEIDIAATEPLAVEDRAFDIDASIARSLERNPNLAIIALSGKATAVSVEITKDGLRPRLDFSANAGPTGNASTTGEAFERLATFETFSISASLTYTQELGARAAEGQHQGQLLSARTIKVNLEEARRNIAADVAAAVNQVRAAKKRIEVSQKSIALAEQNLVNEHARYDAGNSTNFDILRRQEEIEQAKLTHSRAIVDHRKAVAKVDALTGDLLERNGIAIEAENR